jgi:hypothetical protein
VSDVGGTVGVAGTDTGGAIVALNVLAKTVVSQAAFPATTSQELQDLNPHLLVAQGHANDWLNKYSAELLNCLQGIRTAGEVFGHLYANLYAAAQAMATETDFQPNEIAKVVQELQALQAIVQEQLASSTSAYADLTTYSKEVNADYAAFMTDFDTANRVLGGDQGSIKDLFDKIQAEHTAMSNDLAMIGGGAAMIIVGILICAVGVLCDALSFGAATVVVVGGVAVIAAGAAITGYGGKDYDDKMASIADDTKTLLADEDELKLVNGVKGQLTTLTGALGKAQGALGNLVTSWQELDNGIGSVISDLQDPEDYLKTLRQSQPNAQPSTVSAIISAEIATANDDWTSAVTLIDAILGKVRTIQYVTVNNALPTQDEIAKAAAAQNIAPARIRRAQLVG